MNETTIYFKKPEPQPQPGLAAILDGRVIFLPQSGNFWIAAEDNDPEIIPVHVAVKTRRTILDEIPTGAAVLHIPVAFA